MAGKSVMAMLAACAVYLSGGFVAGVEAAEPPYTFLLRSREAVVTPERSKESQTGGGFVQVTQSEPNVLMVVMRGAAAAGSGHHDNSAALQFTLHQDFEVIPTRAGLRPPRLTLSGWVIGALESSRKEGGTAEHSPACAAIRSGDETILQLCVKAHGVGGGENLLINDRVGRLESVVAPGGFCLHQTFAIHASQSKSPCHPGSAVAQFDPDPKLDSQWNETLRPFRAVPQRDFGFRVMLRVLEDTPPVGVPAQELPMRPHKVRTPVLDGEDSTR